MSLTRSASTSTVTLEREHACSVLSASSTCVAHFALLRHVLCLRSLCVFSQGDSLFRKALKGLPTSLLAALVDAELDDPVVLRSIRSASWGPRGRTSRILGTVVAGGDTIVPDGETSTTTDYAITATIGTTTIGTATIGSVIPLAESALAVLVSTARLAQCLLLELKLKRVGVVVG